jgi:polyhydroxybutyrate depolymerase
MTDTRVPAVATPGRARIGATLAALATVALLLAGCGKSDSGSGAGAKSTDGAPKVVSSAPAGKVATAKAVASKGCGSGADTSSETVAKHTLPGDRYYLLTTPKAASATKPLPVVVDIHGLLEGAEVHSHMTQMQTYGQKHGFIVITPNGTGSPIHWEVAPDRKANPDLVYMEKVLDEVEAARCVDTSRVYATGLSNGAFLSSTVACALSNRFAAVAPVSGVTFGEDCKPTRHVPVLTFHGTADPILLFNGGVGPRLNHILSGSKDPEPPLPKADLNGSGYPATVRKWAKANGCKVDDPTETKVTKTVTQRTYQCPADGAVIFDIVIGGGHSWPGSQFSKPLANIMGSTDSTIDANDVIWKFFQRFSLPS